MKLKLSIITLLFLSSVTPMPAQAGIWDSLRNIPGVSYFFGKPVEVNYTAQTRLPVIEAQPSFWSRITNFFAWRNFRTSNQPAAAPQPAQEPVSAPAPQPGRILSDIDAENFVARLDAMREAHEAKKLAELATLEAELTAHEANKKQIYDLWEQTIVLKQNLEKARSEAEHNKKGWTALSNHTRDLDKLIEGKQEELSGLAEQKTIAESEVQRLKEAAAAKRNEEIILLQAQQLREKELARAAKEKEELISAIGQEQKESAQHFYNKNVALEALRKLQLEVEESTKDTQQQFGKLEQKILKLKKELREIRSEKMISEEELHKAKHSVSRIESELKTLMTERNSLEQHVTAYRAQKDSLAFQLKELDSKYSTEQRKTKNEFDAEKKAHEQAKRDLETSRQQASNARASSIEFNRQLSRKDEEIQNIQQVHNSEIAEIQQLLSKKRSEIDLLLAKLEREEKAKSEVAALSTQKSQVLQTITSAIASFETDQAKKISQFKDKVAQKIQRSENRIIAIQAKLPQITKILPQLPVTVEPAKSELDKGLERIEKNLTNLERQRTADASSNGSAIEIFQSNLATSDMPNPALNKSIIGEAVEQFAQLSHTPSPDLPLAEGQPDESKSIYQHMQIDPRYYKEQVERGRKYADAIDADHLNEIPRATQQEYLNSIISIGWHLYDLALQKGQGFMEGTFVIEDRNFKLFNFLMTYSQSQNADIKGTLEDPLHHVSNNPFACSRDASHYVHLKNQFRSYGIDIRFGADLEAQPLLPALKRHILFSKIDEDGDNLIYIKLENYGIYKKDVAKHTKEYLAAQLGKNNIIARSIRSIAYYCNYNIPADSDGGNRKERLVPEFINAFNAAIAKEASFSNEQKKLYMGYAHLEGFKSLYFTPVTGLPSIKALAQKYENHPMRYDHMRWRTGEEVIHRQDQWVPRLALRNGNPSK